MLKEQIRMDKMPDPDKPREYRNLLELFIDADCPDDRKLDAVARICQMETYNSVTKADLLAALRWVVNENYDWVQPVMEPHMRVVK